MKLPNLLRILLVALIGCTAHSQTYFVHAGEGNDSNPGTAEMPFRSIGHAVALANGQTGAGPLTVKLLPGTFVLQDKVVINPVRIVTDSTRYTIEAAMLPDHPEWTPEQMPVILSVSPNNSETQFPHSTGFLVASAHVRFRGLKFLGNPNPSVPFYYPITKENPGLSDLEVTQCMFVGDKEAGKIQGGIWAHGPRNTVSHCVFYECRNAVLFFMNVDGFAIENSIVYGSYESAFWFGPKDPEFTFTNNIIAHNANVIVGPPDLDYRSALTNSVITGNDGYIGQWSQEEQKVVPTANPRITERNLIRKGTVTLHENMDMMLPKSHLHLNRESVGKDLDAGIFTGKQAESID